MTVSRVSALRGNNQYSLYCTSTQKGLELKRLRKKEGQREGSKEVQGGTITVLDIGNYGDEGLRGRENSDDNA